MTASASCTAQQRERVQAFDGLGSARLCAGLGDNTVRAMSELARLKTYTALTEAVTEGRKSTEVEIVTNGRFVVLLTSAQIDLYASGSFNLHLYLPGDCFGLAGLIDSGPAPASIIAGEPSTTIAIPTAGLRRILDNDPASAAVFYRNVCAIQCRRLAALGMQ